MVSDLAIPQTKVVEGGPTSGKKKSLIKENIKQPFEGEMGHCDTSFQAIFQTTSPMEMGGSKD